MSYDAASLLHKLFRLHTRCPAAVDCVLYFAASSSTYAEALSAHERYVDGEAAPPDTELARLLGAESALRDVFSEQPRLSGIEPMVLGILAALADAQPGPEGIPVSRDRAFSYIAGKVADEVGTTSIAMLQQTYIGRLIDLAAALPGLVNELQKNCGREDYRNLVNELDRWLDVLATATERPETPPADFAPLAEACDRALWGDSDRDLLYDGPRISQIPREFIHSFPLQEATRQAMKSGSVMDAMMQKAQQARRVADLMMAENGSDLELSVRLRLEVAQDMLSRRRYVKAQMLEFGWPELLDRIRAPGGQQRLRELERAVLESDSKDDLPSSWQRLLDDERLVDFLHVTPYFQDIFPADLTKLASRPGYQSKVDGSLASSERDLGFEFSPYVDAYLLLKPIGNEVIIEGRSVIEAELTLKIAEEHLDDRVRIPILDIQEAMRALELAYRQRPLGDVRSPAMVVGESFLSAVDVLENLGRILWRTAIPGGPLRDRLLKTLSDSEHVRLIVTGQGPQLSDIPWECLYISALRVFVGLTLKVSVIRNVTEQINLVPRSMTKPLHILVVAAQPADLPAVNVHQEITVLQRTLLPAIQAGIVRLEVVDPPTEELVRERLRKFQPHIFHFVGHGAVQPNGDGVLALTDDQGNAHLVDARQMGIMLQDHKILIAVLNACFTGVDIDQDVGRGVAQVLVRQGVPAAVATTRQVFNHAALQFTREFYRALVDGYPIEAAAVEARKSLSIKGWDWSAYVLYASDDAPLHDLRIPF
jgi:hypothetical protein